MDQETIYKILNITTIATLIVNIIVLIFITKLSALYSAKIPYYKKLYELIQRCNDKANDINKGISLITHSDLKTMENLRKELGDNYYNSSSFLTKDKKKEQIKNFFYRVNEFNILVANYLLNRDLNKKIDHYEPLIKEQFSKMNEDFEKIKLF